MDCLPGGPVGLEDSPGTDLTITKQNYEWSQIPFEDYLGISNLQGCGLPLGRTLQTTEVTSPQSFTAHTFSTQSSVNMELSNVCEEASQPAPTDPDSNHNLSRMRKLSQNAVQFVRKMASSVPSAPPGSPSPATGNTTPNGESDQGHLQASLPPGFAPPPGLPPPGLPPPPGLTQPQGLRPPPGFPPLPPRGALFGSQHSPPARRPGGTHLENCHSLSKTRVVSQHLCALIGTRLARHTHC